MEVLWQATHSLCPTRGTGEGSPALTAGKSSCRCPETDAARSPGGENSR